MILFDRNAGGIMTVFLIVVPLISVFLTVYARKKMKFEIVVPEDLIKKNTMSNIIVKASKNTFLPLPVISFNFSATEHFRKPDYDIYRFSMSENREISININLFPEVCGNAEVKIRKMYITDYLGIFRFRIRLPELSGTVCILPEIREIDDYGEILRSIYNTLPDNDDDDETSAVFGKTAFPGYEYRNYVPGDSLKKINWKLSSKKGQLYVRIDESAGMTLPNIILDITPFDTDISRRSGIFQLEQITEGALSLLNICVRNGIECNFMYPRSGEMCVENVCSQNDVERISCEMLRYMNEPCAVSLEKEAGSKSSDVNIIYSLGISDELAETAETSVADGSSVKVIIPEQLYREETQLVSEVWLMRDDYSLFRLV